MPVSDHAEAFTRALRRLGSFYARAAAEQSAAHGSYSKQDLLALGALGLSGPARMGDLAAHLGVGQSAVTPIVDRLEEHGLARRVRSETDRRVWLVELTPDGRDAFAEEDAVYQDMASAMLSPLEEGERATLVALLEKINLSSDAVE